MQDDGQYHSGSNLVHVGRDWSFEIDRLWTNIDQIEAGGITLDQIGAALNANWNACVIALALGNIGVLRALVAEAVRHD